MQNASGSEKSKAPKDVDKTIGMLQSRTVFFRHPARTWSAKKNVGGDDIMCHHAQHDRSGRAR
jgi:hypothetical protein